MARQNRFFKRPAPPDDVRSDHEIVLFAHAADERLKVKNFAAEVHTVAYLDDVTGGGGEAIEWEDVGSDLPPSVKFGVYPQVGSFLSVEAEGPDPDTPGGYGIRLLDSGGNGIGILSDGGGININTNRSVSIFAGNTMSIQSESSMVLETTDLGADISITANDGLNMSASAGILISSSAGQIHLDTAANYLHMNSTGIVMQDSSGGQMVLQSTTQMILQTPTLAVGGLLGVANGVYDFTVFLGPPVGDPPTAGVFRLVDSSGADILIVEHDGDIHHRTGHLFGDLSP